MTFDREKALRRLINLVRKLERDGHKQEAGELAQVLLEWVRAWP